MNVFISNRANVDIKIILFKESGHLNATRVAMSVTLGQILRHKESIFREYKEFCIKDNVFNHFTKKEVSQFVRKGVIPNKFNSVMRHNLDKYIREYVPKYVCAFHNTEGGSRKRMLRIGVDDACEVTGIPYHGDLMPYLGTLKSRVDEAVKATVSKTCRTMRYEVILRRCSVHVELLDDRQLLWDLAQHDEMKERYEFAVAEYTKTKDKWNKKVAWYKGKLRNIFMDYELQVEFLDYLKEKGLDERFRLPKESCRQMKNVKRFKYDKNNYLHWLIEFKEDRVQELLRNKPVKPLSPPKVFNTEYCHMTQLSHLRRRLLESNTDLTYYVLDIIVDVSECVPLCPCQMVYCDTITGTWRKIKRKDIDNIPRCYDMDDDITVSLEDSLFGDD